MSPLDCRATFPFLLALLSLVQPAQAAPGGVTSQAQVSVEIVSPLTVASRSPLSFGQLSAAGAGTATLLPGSGSLRTTGGVSLAGGAPAAAEFVGTVPAGMPVEIRLPTEAIAVRRLGGSETMRVDAFTLGGESRQTNGRQTSMVFRVGATLTVGPNQPPGLYSGTFDVIVEHP